MPDDIKIALTELLTAAEAMSSDVGSSVASLLREGLERPLSPDEIRTLLTRVVEVVRHGAQQRGDVDTVLILERDPQSIVERAAAESLVTRVRELQGQLSEHPSTPSSPADPADETEDEPPVVPASCAEALRLQSHDGIDPMPVRPNPVFNERPVAVIEGFVRTRDIRLWDRNQRLDIHLNQFQQKYGRGPDALELVEIMKGAMPLPGIMGEDQFAIRSLAKSIAVNGVRKPPIIDVDGTLLDGNRRVTACYDILEDSSGDFRPEEKQRAEWLKVWQLTDHATEQDREAVIVSLNFEPDHKQDWPEYVKAQKVYEDWEALLALEPRANPGRKRQQEIRRDIARRFALSTNEVTRYISMVALASEFEDYHVAERSKDAFETKHRAADKFQYFDELNKGKGAGGVNWCLNKDEVFKHLVFDLLYDGKFKRWERVRDLKHVYENEDAVAGLRKARDEPDVEEAQEEVENAIGLARMSRAAQRQTGANTRIRVFTEWFLELPVKAFDPSEAGCVHRDNLERLHSALKHVEAYLTSDSLGDTST
ncbi:MAG: hypothetical protein OXH52_15185 [Gammaproteobacteria bacterium]|nr:hypothetical protein [Gammaproteobacteria bacterium]